MLSSVNAMYWSASEMFRSKIKRSNVYLRSYKGADELTTAAYIMFTRWTGKPQCSLSESVMDAHSSNNSVQAREASRAHRVSPHVATSDRFPHSLPVCCHSHSVCLSSVELGVGVHRILTVQESPAEITGARHTGLGDIRLGKVWNGSPLWNSIFQLCCRGNKRRHQNILAATKASKPFYSERKQNALSPSINSWAHLTESVAHFFWDSVTPEERACVCLRYALCFAL